MLVLAIQPVMVACTTTAAWGQIVTDPLAPLEFMPQVSDSELGTPVIDIAAPSPAGLSHNKFQEYNIDTRGVILNNSSIGGTSILGGAVGGNPNLVSKPSASTILNEVTSASPSEIKGTTEVFGRKANVIIANPNGIDCQGCNFINADKVTLSTGTPRPDYNTGRIGFDVSDGLITIQGSGVSAVSGEAPLSKIDVIGRQIEVDAPLTSSGKTRLISGAGSYNQGSSFATKATEGSVLQDEFGQAFSLSENGRVSAGSIFIQAHDAGRAMMLHGVLEAHGTRDRNGVLEGGSIDIIAGGDISLHAARAHNDIKLRSAGQINIAQSPQPFIATQYLGVDAAGRLSLHGDDISIAKNAIVKAKDAALFEAYGSLENEGKIASDTFITLVSKDRLSISGEIAAPLDVLLEGRDVKGSDLRIIGNDIHVIGIESAHLINTDFFSRKDVQITGRDLTLGEGVLFTADGIIRLDASGVLSTNTALDYNNLKLAIGNGLEVGPLGSIVQDRIDWVLPWHINNAGKIHSNSDLSLNAHIINNMSGGTLSGKQVTLIASEELSNKGSIAALSKVEIQARQLDNAGTLQGIEHLAILAAGLNNNGVFSGGKSVLLELGEGLVINDSAGSILAQTAILVHGSQENTFINRGLIKAFAVNFDLPSARIINEKNIETATLEIKGRRFANMANGVLKTLHASIDVSRNFDGGGIINADDALAVRAANISLSKEAKTTIYAPQLHLLVEEAITAYGDFAITADERAIIKAPQGNIDFLRDERFKNSGALGLELGDRGLHVQRGEILQLPGTLDLKLSGNVQIDGALKVGGDLKLETDAGIIIPAVDPKVGVTREAITAVGHIQLKGASLRNAASTISAGQSLVIQVPGEIVNTRADRVRYAIQSGHVTKEGERETSAGAALVASQHILLQASQVDNIASTIAAGGVVQISASRIANTNRESLEKTTVNFVTKKRGGIFRSSSKKRFHSNTTYSSTTAQASIVGARYNFNVNLDQAGKGILQGDSTNDVVPIANDDLTILTSTQHTSPVSPSAPNPSDISLPISPDGDVEINFKPPHFNLDDLLNSGEGLASIAAKWEVPDDLLAGWRKTSDNFDRLGAISLDNEAIINRSYAASNRGPSWMLEDGNDARYAALSMPTLPSGISIDTDSFYNAGSMLSDAHINIYARQSIDMEGGEINAAGSMVLQSDQHINLMSRKKTEASQITSKKSSYSQIRTKHILSSIKAGQDLRITAPGQLTIHGLQAQAGKNMLVMAHDLSAAPVYETVVTISDTRGRGFLRKTRSHQDIASSRGIGTQLVAGADLGMIIDQDLTAIGGRFAADGRVQAQAQNVVLAPSFDEEIVYNERRVSGFGISGSSGNGGVGMSIGHKSDRRVHSTQSRTVAPTVIASGAGVEITASHDLTAVAAEIEAAGDLTLTGDHNLSLLAADDEQQTYTSRTKKFAGLTVSIGQNVSGAVQSLGSAASTAQSGHGGAGYQAVGLASGVMQGIDAVSQLSNPTVTASVSLGMSKTQTQFRQQSSTARPVALVSSVNMDLAALDKLHLEGTQARAEGHLRLIAGKDVQIESAQSTYAQSQSSTHKQAGIGAEVRASVSGSVAAGITISGSTSSSRSHEASTHHENARIASGTDVAIISGQDTTIAGAQIKAPAVDVQTGRNLTIASRQDTTVGASRSRHASASGMLGIVGTSSFNASVGAGEGSTDRAWVEEQTSLTGDHVAIDTAGHTQLDGALIAANDNAQTLSTGTLGHSDIVDHDERRHKQATVGFSTANTGNVLKGGSISGEISNLTREQITRATVGEGAIVVRDGKADIATLNRDINRVQEITRDEASGVSFYASTSAVAEAASGFEGIRENVEATARGLSHLDQTVSDAYAAGKSVVEVAALALKELNEPSFAHAVESGDLSLESVIKQIKGGACGGGQHGFNLHNLLFPPAFAADCTFETLSGKQITISAKDDCIDAIIASLQGQVLAVTWNAKEFSIGLKDGAIKHGEAFVELVSDPKAVLDAVGTFASEVISDPKAAGKKYGTAIVSDLQEQSGKYIAALAAGNYKEAGELAAGLAIDLTIKIAIPAAGTSIAVLKSSTAIEKLAAKLGRREGSGLAQVGGTSYVAEKPISVIKDNRGSSFVKDALGNTIDLNFTKGLVPTNIRATGTRGGVQYPLQGQIPNSYANLGNGHVVVYGPDGRALYDISESRIKVVEWNQAPNGNFFPRKGRDTKVFEGSVPQSILNDLGIK